MYAVRSCDVRLSDAADETEEPAGPSVLHSMEDFPWK